MLFPFSTEALSIQQFFTGHEEVLCWSHGATYNRNEFVPFLVLFLGCLCLSGQEVNAAQVSFGVAVRGFLYIICRWGSTLIFSIYLYISIIYWGGIIF